MNSWHFNKCVNFFPTCFYFVVVFIFVTVIIDHFVVIDGVADDTEQRN
jgi:hypothetical protein